MSSSDDFDDDDVDFDQVFAAAKAAKTQSKAPSAASAPVHSEPLQGENAILRARIKQLNKEHEEDQKRLRSRYTGLLKENADKIDALTDRVSRFKEENEFLTSENRNLNMRRTPKRRKVGGGGGSQVSQTPLRTPLVSSESTQSPTTQENTTAATANESSVVIWNQTTILQDEKMQFIESISAQVISGLHQTTFGYLAKISSAFGYRFKGFSTGNPGESIKTSIVNYLIAFEDKNRIDVLVSEFIEILLDYILCSLSIHDDMCSNRLGENEENSQTTTNPSGSVIHWLDLRRDRRNDGSVLLSLPYLLSLVHFALNYRPKAINAQVLEATTEKIVSILQTFPEILKQDSFYLSCGDETDALWAKPEAEDDDDRNVEYLDFQLSEKIMHVKVLEVFTVCYSLDILETLAKLASFWHTETGESSYLNNFWQHIPPSLTLLSSKTPAIFVHNIVEILISSITDTSFAFENVTTLAEDDAAEGNRLIFESLIGLLDDSALQPALNIDIYGLNRGVGSNGYIRLLEILTPTKVGLTNKPVTHSPGTYKAIVNTSTYSWQWEFLVLKIKLKILQMFELYLSYSRVGTVAQDILVRLIDEIVTLLGKEQELVLRSPQSRNMECRMELIATVVRLVHFLLSAEGPVSIPMLEFVTLRELVVALLRISADSLRNLSIEFLTKLRLEDGFKHHVFNEQLETALLDRSGLLDEIDSRDADESFRAERVQVEVSASNGIQINYDDETIDMARDVIGQCLTSDEADQLHYSINYDIPDDDADISM